MVNTRKAIIFIVAFSLAIKVIYVLCQVVYDRKVTAGDTGFGEIISTFKKADAGWYAKIFTEGYPTFTQRDSIGLRNGGNSVQSAWAFFPGYPYAVKATAILIKTGFNTAALIFELLFSTAFFILLFIFLQRQFSPQVSLTIVLTVMCFPFNFFYSMFYSEAIFMSLMIGALLLIEKKNFIGAAFCLGLMVMVRSTGLVMLVVVFFYSMHADGKRGFMQIAKSFLTDGKQWTKIILLFSFPFIAFGSWCFYQWRITGFWNAFSIAQEGWYHTIRFPLFSLFRGGDWQNQFLSWYTVFFLLVGVLLFKHLLLYEKIWVIAGLLFPLCFGSVISMPRYISIILPLFYYFGKKIYASGYRNAIISLLTAAQLVSFYFWLKGDPISF
ncbi:MAG: hypothetical protein ABI763_05335 [Bacteroidota bacterium]